jgi:hypothetical protein
MTRILNVISNETGRFRQVGTTRSSDLFTSRVFTTSRQGVIYIILALGSSVPQIQPPPHLHRLIQASLAGYSRRQHCTFRRTLRGGHGLLKPLPEAYARALGLSETPQTPQVRKHIQSVQQHTLYSKIVIGLMRYFKKLSCPKEDGHLRRRKYSLHENIRC